MTVMHKLSMLHHRLTSSSVITADTDGTRLTESIVVVEYLDAKYPDQGSKLVPADATQAAQVSDIVLHRFSCANVSLFAIPGYTWLHAQCRVRI